MERDAVDIAGAPRLGMRSFFRVYCFLYLEWNLCFIFFADKSFERETSIDGRVVTCEPFEPKTNYKAKTWSCKDMKLVNFNIKIGLDHFTCKNATLM